MPNQVLARGFTANLGAHIVPGNLNLVGVGANYSVAIGGAAPVVGVAGAVVFAVNGATVRVSNTTAVAGAPNLTISW